MHKDYCPHGNTFGDDDAPCICGKPGENDVICRRCGYYGLSDTFTASLSAYHDMCCPKCGTTNIDTSRDDEAGFGDNNVLDMSGR